MLPNTNFGICNIINFEVFRKLGQVDNRIYYIVCGCSVAKNAKVDGLDMPCWSRLSLFMNYSFDPTCQLLG